nr:hypothetical protein [uncultured Pseudomonas sp.]
MPGFNHPETTVLYEKSRDWRGGEGCACMPVDRREGISSPPKPQKVIVKKEWRSAVMAPGYHRHMLCIKLITNNANNSFLFWWVFFESTPRVLIAA